MPLPLRDGLRAAAVARDVDHGAREISRKVDVLVQGGRSPRYKGGQGGQRHETTRKLRKQGHPIAIIGEAEFRALVWADE